MMDAENGGSYPCKSLVGALRVERSYRGNEGRGKRPRGRVGSSSEETTRPSASERNGFGFGINSSGGCEEQRHRVCDWLGAVARASNPSR